MRLIYKITIPVVLVLGGLSFFVFFFFSSSLQNAMLEQEFLSVRDAVTKGAQALTLNDFANPTSTAAQADFAVFYDAVTNPSIARFTVWDDKGWIIYSDLSSIVGQSYEVGTPDVENALTTGEPFYSVKVQDAGTPKQTDVPNFMDIFIPVQMSGQTVGVVEVRAVIGAVLHPIAQQISDLTFGLIAAMIVIFASVLLAFRLFVTGPLSTLKDVSTQVIRGDLSARAKIKTKDELGEVTHFINEMLSRVEKSQQELQTAKEGVEEIVKLRTKELTEEKARLLASLAGLSLGFIITEGVDKMTYANAAAARIFDAEPGDLTMADIDHKLKDALDFREERKKSIERERLIELKEVRFQNKFLRIFAAPIVPPGADVAIGSVAVFEDVTEMRLLDYAKASFVAIASHELRTPLTIIRGNAELLLDDMKEKGTEYVDRVKSIYDGSVRLLDIVNDFLDLTALEEKKVQFKRDSFNIVELAQGIANDLKPRADKKNLVITVQKPEGALPNVVADHERTKEVFVNLIANAIQYTEKGGITLTFAPNGDKVQAFVSDTGVGIPPERQAALFRKFNTVQEKFLRQREYGSGMGLYIAHLIMSSMDGTVGLFKSAPGEGSTFVITFPTQDSAPPAENPS